MLVNACKTSVFTVFRPYFSKNTEGVIQFVPIGFIHGLKDFFSI
jgi:hypothetical protein